MKHKELLTTKVLLASFVILLFFSNCKGVRYVFSEPQPMNAKNIKKFPKKMIDKYNLDGVDFVITKNSILTGFIIEHKDSLTDTNLKFTSDSSALVDIETGESFYCEIFGDSITIFSTYFDINDGDLLRKFKGAYFLNIQNDSTNLWTVEKIDFNRDSVIRSLIDSADIEKLQKITNDTGIVFNPTKKQFKQFLKEGGFGKKQVIRLR